ncbi:uncharacterized protein LOC129577227 [Sitodiplosis mosellana]|uniref:uncharacterized protein LOC129577227 n=1 Tax=Sitodiplosis mosellana TaxID=263140 RepID=UPI002443E3C3|nr:uncharacterized protein LOC129577227 [Sitodiplosis mosellana]
MYCKIVNCAHILLPLFIIPFVGARLVDSNNYVDKVVEQMVACMDNNRKFIDKNFPVDDCESTINTTRYGQTAIGKVEFRSGFLASIDSAIIPKPTYHDYINNKQSWMEAEFKLCGVTVFYDVHYNLEDNKKGDATFRVKYDSVDFDLNIVREHNAEVKSTLIYRGINSGGRGQWGTAVTTHPNTPQVQLITNTIRSDSHFRDPLMKTLAQWNLPLDMCLKEAIQKVEYPEINYLQ